MCFIKVNYEHRPKEDLVLNLQLLYNSFPTEVQIYVSMMYSTPARCGQYVSEEDKVYVCEQPVLLYLVEEAVIAGYLLLVVQLLGVYLLQCELGVDTSTSPVSQGAAGGHCVVEVGSTHQSRLLS